MPAAAVAEAETIAAAAAAGTTSAARLRQLGKGYSRHRRHHIEI